MPARRIDTLRLLPMTDNEVETPGPFCPEHPTPDYYRTTPDHRFAHLDDDACVIRAIIAESIDNLFPPIDDAFDTEMADDPMTEPVLDCVVDQRVQYVGQMVAPPRARRRQRLLSSRAVLHTTLHGHS
jgi:hypothetical protein